MNRTCQECGMLLDEAGEFHPHAFCVWKKAGLDPWDTMRWVAERLQLPELPSKPPLVRNLRESVSVPTTEKGKQDAC